MMLLVHMKINKMAQRNVPAFGPKNDNGTLSSVRDVMNDEDDDTYDDESDANDGWCDDDGWMR